MFSLLRWNVSFNYLDDAHDVQAVRRAMIKSSNGENGDKICLAHNTFICLKRVDFPDSPAPKRRSLIFSCSFWNAAALAASTSFVCNPRPWKDPPRKFTGQNDGWGFAHRGRRNDSQAGTLQLVGNTYLFYFAAAVTRFQNARGYRGLRNEAVDSYPSYPSSITIYRQVDLHVLILVSVKYAEFHNISHWQCGSQCYMSSSVVTNTLSRSGPRAFPFETANNWRPNAQ